MNRQQRRASQRDEQRETSKLVQRIRLADAALITDKKHRLRRRIGNPTKRLAAFREWFEVESEKRS